MKNMVHEYLFIIYISNDILKMESTCLHNIIHGILVTVSFKNSFPDSYLVLHFHSNDLHPVWVPGLDDDFSCPVHVMMYLLYWGSNLQLCTCRPISILTLILPGKYAMCGLCSSHIKLIKCTLCACNDVSVATMYLCTASFKLSKLLNGFNGFFESCSSN